MSDTSWLWALFTIIAAASQTARNATQRELTTTLGTAGATHVRFLFGLPFALVFLAMVLLATGVALPRPPAIYWAWVLDGALAQIAATALMLAAMNDRSFVVVYAYIKTEPVQAALFGLVFLGDVVTLPMAAAILIATTGVVIMALKPGTALGLKATLLGLAAGAMFALSAVGFRGAILSVGSPNYLMAATFTMVTGLTIQVALLSPYLLLRNPAVMRAIRRSDLAAMVVPPARSPRSSGSSPLRWRRRRACARWRWSKCYSRRPYRPSSSSRRRRRARRSASC